MLVCALWLNTAYFAFAVSSSVDVQQTVIYTGGGFSLPVDATPPEISNVKIYDVGRHSAKVFWQTDEACFAELRYGLTSKFESGPLYDHPDSYERSHEFTLENLKPGSRYYLKITAKNSRGVERSTVMHDFYTAPEISAVSNVGSLSAFQDGKQVVLRWRNPSGENFRGVQINRQAGSPSLAPNEGEKVFSGRAESLTDASVVDNTGYYYTIFSYDASGNFSSGAIVSIRTDFSAPESGSGKEDGGSEGAPASEGGENTGGGSGKTGDAGGEETAAGGIGNVADLSAVPDMQNKKITLSWKCPESDKECIVEVRRSTGSPDGSPSEGELIYSGLDTSFEDADAKEGQSYFYTVFTKSKTGAYSSGMAAVSQLPGPDESGSPSDVSFTNATRGLLLASDEGGSIHMLEGDNLGINCVALLPPASFKTVVVLVDNAAYLLNFSADAQSHWTTLAVPRAGAHDLMISFINADNKMISYRHFVLNVVPKGKIFVMKNEVGAENFASKDKLLCLLGNLAGGNDGNCMKIQGVEGAKITIFRKNGGRTRETWNAEEFNQNNPSFSGSDGSFGFSVPNGEYEIMVEKNGFDAKTISLSVENNIIAENIEINMEKNNIYAIILMSILLIPIAVYMIRFRLRIKRK